ncbi:hypothetical protein CR3_gp129 [Cronobacter phage CR3]|uniref:Uncharacterized protein n=2 Tax=Certrevirus TaxID=1914850 RepID=I1TRH1_9CAUD|nr:hypothetical protein CR3_gp129 [Cronobacter phage CR3]YP_009042370.1 hypothetical protein HL10_gp133 [Cronobacter phage CR8]AFH21294.1 hypothetical protein CR3_129 [Cronobacter phage CR3]AIA64663.1 hypothetical protein CR8_133 [Cronobacter phage CR8]
MFTFNAKTSEAVQKAIMGAYNRGDRVRVWYGNTETGESWLDEYDVTGKIGRSMGEQKIPLLVKNSRSYGGGALLDSSIIRIDSINSRRTLYKHPNFNTGNLVQCAPNSADYVEAVARHGGDELIAQFKKPGQAARWIAFMNGERYAK